MEWKNKIAELIGMESIYITAFFMDEDVLYFTVMMSDQFRVYVDGSGTLEADTLTHMRTFEPIEEIPF